MPSLTNDPRRKALTMAIKSEIENAILDATGRPDSGAIRDNLGAIVDAVLRVVNPTPAPAAKADKEVRVVKTEETR